MRHIGIYLAPDGPVEMRAEGLGRYLAFFVKSALSDDDVAVTILCPSYLRRNLVRLFEDETVDPARTRILSPSRTSYFQSAYEKTITKFFNHVRFHTSQKAKDNTLVKLGALVYKQCRNLSDAYLRGLAAAHTKREMFRAAMITAVIAPLALLMSLLAVSFSLVGRAWMICKRMPSYLREAWIWLLKSVGMKKAATRISTRPGGKSSLSRRMLRFAYEAEVRRMVAMANKAIDVDGWLSLSAFWPSFSLLPGRKVLCVPDFVIGEFPVGFALDATPEAVEGIRNVIDTIKTATNFVTYSKHIKDTVLVEKFGKKETSISVIPHACSTFERETSGTIDQPQQRTKTSSDIVITTLVEKVPRQYAGNRLAEVPKYLFYASQFRPSKNVITLLKAFIYLKRFADFPHKLILTGRRAISPREDDFIRSYGLDSDVWCINGLSTKQLAAFYECADLAVNPTLSEGGFPFTFTEALSVGTPVLMGRIAVVEEVMTDERMRLNCLFDPYSWRDMASKIQNALHSRDEIRKLQLPLYQQLSQRTWGDVVNEYIECLCGSSS